MVATGRPALYNPRMKTTLYLVVLCMASLSAGCAAAVELGVPVSTTLIQAGRTSTGLGLQAGVRWRATDALHLGVYTRETLLFSPRSLFLADLAFEARYRLRFGRWIPFGLLALGAMVADIDHDSLLPLHPFVSPGLGIEFAATPIFHVGATARYNLPFLSLGETSGSIDALLTLSWNFGRSR